MHTEVCYPCFHTEFRQDLQKLISDYILQFEVFQGRILELLIEKIFVYKVKKELQTDSFVS